MYIALCYGCHYCVGCIIKCGMVVMAMLAVYCSVLWLSVLCCMYIWCALNVKTISVVYRSAVRLS